MFCALTYHLPFPFASTVAGVIEHIDCPASHPACAGVYATLFIFNPVASYTNSRYVVTDAPVTAFHVYVGVLVLIVPLGDTCTGAEGKGIVRTLNVILALHG